MHFKPGTPTQSRRPSLWIAAAAGAAVLMTSCSATTERPTADSVSSVTASATSAAPSTSALAAADAMAEWATTIGPPMQQTSKALNEFAAAMKATADGNFTGFPSACTDIDDAQVAVRAHLPAPDAALNAKMVDFVDDLHAAAGKCAGFGPETTDADGDQMMADIKNAGQELNDALAGISAAMGAKP